MPPETSLAGKVTARLHLTVRGARRAPVDDIAVVTENARELLGDVRAAVSTAGAR